MRVLLCALVCVLTPAVAVRAVDQPLPSQIVEATRVDVVEAWPFLVIAKKRKDAEVCAQLGEGNLRVFENGKAMRILSVESAPPLTAHVIMMDTSGSMSDPATVISRRRSRQTKAAAKTYIEWMLADVQSRSAAGVALDANEELMVVTFDDDLIMRIPRTRVTDPLVAADLVRRVYQIRGGYKTLLNDSLFLLVRYLASRAERSVVILLSDGADSSSLNRYETVAEVVEAASNVTVFSIGIGLPEGPQVEFLEQIADVSGGKYYWVRSRGAGSLGPALEKRFANIRARLAGQLYVSYLAEPYGGLEDDLKQLDDSGGARRRVKIESLDRRCAIPEDGYRRSRYLRPPGELLEDRDASSGEAPLDAEFVAERGVLRIELRDRVLDREPLIRYDAVDESAAWKVRTVEVLLPVFDSDPTADLAQRKPPEDVIHEWLVEGLIPERAEPGRPPSELESCFPIAQEMNGAMFLVGRTEIAEALFNEHDAFRQWALERLAERVRVLYRSRVPVPEAADERSKYDAAIEAIVADRVRRARPEDYVQDLAEWHEDVAARELAYLLERKEANLLLEGGAEAQAIADLIQQRWLRLHDWLFFPDRVRVLTPLELTCDPVRQVCGFFRIVLPRFRDLPEDPDRSVGKIVRPQTVEQFIEYENAKVPLIPLGLAWVRWLLALPVEPNAGAPTPSPARLRLAEVLRTNWSVETIRHGPVAAFTPSERGKLPDEDPYCLQRITIGFCRNAPSGCQERAKLDVTVRVPSLSTGPPDTDPTTVLNPCQPELPLRLLPACYYRATDGGSSVLEALVRDAGFDVCSE